MSKMSVVWRVPRVVVAVIAALGLVFGGIVVGAVQAQSARAADPAVVVTPTSDFWCNMGSWELEQINATSVGVDYSVTYAGDLQYVIATARPGYELTLDGLPPTWQWVSEPTVAQYVMDCWTPPQPIEIPAPQVAITQPVCLADGTATRGSIEVVGGIDTWAMFWYVDDEYFDGTTPSYPFQFDPGSTAVIRSVPQGVYSFLQPLTPPWQPVPGWPGQAQLTVTFDDPDCVVPPTPVAVADPVVVQASCTASGVVVPPTLSLPTTAGVAYAVTGGAVVAGGSVTVTATPEAGFVLTAGGAWTLQPDGTATLVVALDDVECVVPPVLVAPVAPTVTAAACTSGGLTTLPVVETESDARVAYTVEGTVAAGTRVVVRAAPAPGFVLAPADGWMLQVDGTATYPVDLAKPSCVVTPPTTNPPTTTPPTDRPRTDRPTSDPRSLAVTGDVSADAPLWFAGLAVALGVVAMCRARLRSDARRARR